MKLECRGLHSLVKAEKGNADVTAGTEDLSWQAKRKNTFKNKREKSEESPPHLHCLPAQAEPPTCKGPSSPGPGLPPSWISPLLLSPWSETIIVGAWRL